MRPVSPKYTQPCTPTDRRFLGREGWFRAQAAEGCRPQAPAPGGCSSRSLTRGLRTPWGAESSPSQSGGRGRPARADQPPARSPSGKKFRSKPQLARYLGGSMDLSTFDFRTGKMLMNKMNKSRQRVRYDSSNQVKALSKRLPGPSNPPWIPVGAARCRVFFPQGKPDLNTALPVRQTASIFKQPVTKITNHPSNKVKSDPQKAVDQPRQLFWEKKLSGLSAFDIAEELVRTMDLPKGLQGVGPGCTDETLLSAIASALHTSTLPITGQLSAAVEKNPGVWLNTAQPLCKAFMVTDDDIRKQEELVQQVRKRLEEALMADMLAHVEELARDGEAPLDKACAEDEEDEDEEDDEPEPERV
nr:methyl-CpG-binding domain protein 3 isoform X1 [Peromyscus maniculatus bairdii]